MMPRPPRLMQVVMLIGLLLGLVASSSGNLIATAADEPSSALTLKAPKEAPTTGTDFEIELALKSPFGTDYQLTIPEHLTVDLEATEKANPKTIRKLVFDEQKRELTITLPDEPTATTLKLVVQASTAQTYHLTAKTTVTLPEITADSSSEDSVVAESTSTESAKPQTLTAEPISFTVTEPVKVPAAEIVSDSTADESSSKETTSSESKTNDQSNGDDKKASDKSADTKTESESTTESTKESESSTKTTEEKPTVKTATVKAAAALAADDPTQTVTTYAEFKTAYTNTAVTTILIGADISAPSTAATDLGTRTTALTIDGQNHSFDIGLANFRLGTTAAATNFTIKNFKLLRAAATTGTGTSGSLGIIQSGADGGTTASGANWEINVADLTTDSSVQRLVSSPGNRVTVSGTVNSTTVWESMLTGGVVFAANSHFTARKKYTSGENRSFFWFSASSGYGTGDRKVVINSGAIVDCVGAPTDTLYPVFFDQYDSITVDTNATLIAKMYGNAYRAQRASTFTANTGSKTTFENLSTTSGNTINYASTATSTFTVNSGAEIYITNNATAPVFGGTLSGVNVLLNSPKVYDIKNTSAGLLAATASIVNISIGSFEIRNSNLSVWLVTLPLNVVSAKWTFRNVEWIKQTGLIMTSSDGLLGISLTLTSFSLARRINNTVAMPTAVYSSPYTSDLGAVLVTDADKKVRLRVITSLSDSGVPTYATAGQATVKLTDDQGVVHSATTDASGYVNYTLDHFLTAGKTLSAVVNVSYDADPVTIVVQDKTPPNPVTAKDGKIVADQKTITGSTTTAGNKISYTINGSAAVDSSGTAITATAAADGSWSLALPTPALKAGDVIRLLVTDAAGNVTPLTATTYHDATFAAASQYTVAPANGPTAPTEPDSPGNPNTSGSENSGTGNTGELRLDYAPSQFNFGTVKTSMKSATYNAQSITGVLKQWLQVSDNRLSTNGWTVTARQSAAFTSTSGAQLTGATLNLPAGDTHNQHAGTSGLKSYGIQINSVEQPVFGAAAATTSGKDLSTSTWNPTAVSLTVPGNTAKAQQTYTAGVTWTLTANVTN